MERQSPSKRQENEKILMEIKNHTKTVAGHMGPKDHRGLTGKGNEMCEKPCSTLNEDTWHCREGKKKKKFKATTNSKHNLPVAENLLNQNCGREAQYGMGLGYYVYCDIGRLAVLGGNPGSLFPTDSWMGHE